MRRPLWIAALVSLTLTGASHAQAIFTFVADTNTAIPGGTDNFAATGAPAVSGGVVTFRGTGSSGQQGLYSGSGGALTRLVDLNTAIPGGTGNFTSISS